MRSVKAARNHSSGRVRSSRQAPRARTSPSRSTFGRRRRNDRLSLFIERVRSWPARRRPMLWLTLALLLVALVGGMLAAGYPARAVHAVGTTIDNITADAGFGISSIRLSGNHRTRPGEVLTALGLDDGQSIFTVDVRAARRQLLALPWVFDADVRRQYPDLISVNIIERQPFALWQSDRGLFVVERSGHVIVPAQEGKYPHLPLLAGAGAPESAAAIVDAVMAHRATSARVRGYQRVSNRRWNLVLDGGVLVDLPEEGWQKELDVLEQLIVDKGVLERDISEIDLRSPDRFIFLLRNGQRQQGTRGNAA